MISNKAPPILSSTLLSTKKKKKQICGALLLGVKKKLHMKTLQIARSPTKLGPSEGILLYVTTHKRAPDLTVLRGQKRTPKKKKKKKKKE
jgi:hypothetical protein